MLIAILRIMINRCNANDTTHDNTNVNHDTNDKNKPPYHDLTSRWFVIISSTPGLHNKIPA